MLLLDEPLGALDLKLRRQMQIELKRIQTEIGITFVHVTHDQEEAMTMADTIAVMNHGVIEQMGAPGELYENPQTTFVANFLGQSNLITTDVVDSAGDDRRDRLPRPEGRGRGVALRTSTGGTGWLGVRPEKIFASRAGTEEQDGRQRADRGPDHRRQLRRREHPVPRRDALGPGADGVRAEHRSTCAVSATATRSTSPGRATTRSCSTPTRTRTPGMMTPEDAE